MQEAFLSTSDIKNWVKLKLGKLSKVTYLVTAKLDNLAPEPVVKTMGFFFLFKFSYPTYSTPLVFDGVQWFINCI